MISYCLYNGVRGDAILVHLSSAMPTLNLITQVQPHGSAILSPSPICGSRDISECDDLFRCATIVIIMGEAMMSDYHHRDV